MTAVLTRRQLAEMLLASGIAGRLARAAGQVIAPGLITSIVVAEDCANLATFSSELSSARRTALGQARPFVQLGALLPDPDQLTSPLLSTNAPEGIALAAGAMFSKVAAELTAALPEQSRLCADVLLLKQTCGSTVNVSERDLLDLLHAMRSRRMIELHTLIPDTTDVSGWLERLFAVEQKQDALFLEIAKAWVSPPPAMRELQSRNFYNADDPVIRLAVATQHGRAIAPGEIPKAIASANNRSLYGKALVAGYRLVARA